MKDRKKEYFISVYALVISIIVIILLTFFIVSIIYGLLVVDFTIFMFGCMIVSLVMLWVLIESIQNLYKFSRLYFKDIPALILTADTLIDNINNQIYSWAEIKNITKESTQSRTGTNFIAISLVGSDECISKITNSYRRLIARINERYFRGAFSIQPNLIKCKNNELFDDLTQYFLAVLDVGEAHLEC